MEGICLGIQGRNGSFGGIRRTTRVTSPPEHGEFTEITKESAKAYSPEVPVVAGVQHTAGDWLRIGTSQKPS